MMKRRVVKAAAERKAEIVDCALTLFLTRGYEATTIADILKRTRLSKGAFYHHFASKEDVLEAAMERLIGDGIAAVQDVVDDELLNELTRLKRLFVRFAEWQVELNLQAVAVDMIRPENAALFLRIKSSIDKIILPIFSRIVERGTRNGEFDAPDAELVAEMLLFVANARQPALARAIEMAARGQLDGALELAEENLAVRSKMMDRVLGLPPGTIEFGTMPRTQIDALVEAARKTKTRRKS